MYVPIPVSSDGDERNDVATTRIVREGVYSAELVVVGSPHLVREEEGRYDANVHRLM